MSAKLNLKIGVVAAGLSCLLLGYAAAQQDQSPGQIPTIPLRDSDPNAVGQPDGPSVPQVDRSTTRTRSAHAVTGGQNQGVEHFLANCLLAQNEAEVQLSELAQQKSENADVKQFAQRMIQDHRKMIEHLQPLAGMQAGAAQATSSTFGAQSESQGRSDATEGRTSDTRALPGSSGASRTIPPSGTTAAAPRIGTPTDATTSGSAIATIGTDNGALHQLMQIERQIGERCLQTTRNEMQQKSGAEFDKCYIGSAIGAHVHALAALEVIGQQTNGQLAQVAQQAQPTVQQHLESATQLMKQLEGQSSGRQAERQSTRTER